MLRQDYVISPVLQDTWQISMSFEEDVAERKEPKKNEGRRIEEDFSEHTKNYKISFLFFIWKIKSSVFKIMQIKSIGSLGNFYLHDSMSHLMLKIKLNIVQLIVLFIL